MAGSSLGRLARIQSATGWSGVQRRNAFWPMGLQRERRMRPLLVGSKGRESPSGHGVFRGSTKAPLNGDATAKRCTGARGSMPKLRRMQGVSNRGRHASLWQDCADQEDEIEDFVLHAHILRPSLSRLSKTGTMRRLRRNAPLLPDRSREGGVLSLALTAVMRPAIYLCLTAYPRARNQAISAARADAWLQASGSSGSAGSGNAPQTRAASWPSDIRAKRRKRRSEAPRRFPPA